VKLSGSKRKAQKVPPPRHGHHRPVDDSNDVGVDPDEIRAADLAAQMEMGQFNGFTLDEHHGYLRHDTKIESWPDTNLAGWLSRQIYIHDSLIVRDGFDDRTADARIIGALAAIGEDHVPPDGWEEKVLTAVDETGGES
jgi:hypothetical protein